MLTGSQTINFCLKLTSGMDSLYFSPLNWAIICLFWKIFLEILLNTCIVKERKRLLDVIPRWVKLIIDLDLDNWLNRLGLWVWFIVTSWGFVFWPLNQLLILWDSSRPGAINLMYIIMLPGSRYLFWSPFKPYAINFWKYWVCWNYIYLCFQKC